MDLPIAESPADRSTKLASPHELRTERIFALVIVTVPFLALLFAAVWQRITLTDILITAVMYTVTGLGITVGYHRLFTHQSFECPRWLRAAFAISGSMAAQGPVIRWVADHRRHHQFSDKSGDPHSPNLDHHGFIASLTSLWHSHVGWFFAAQKTRIRRFVPDLLEDGQLTRIDRRYLLWLALSLAIPAGLGALLTGTVAGALSALLWGGLVRMFLIHHVTWSINSVCHVFGRRPFQSRDRSTNVAWLAIPSLGESWHNAHHAFPTSAVHGVERFQLDLSALLIRALEACGLATSVKRPDAAQIQARRTATTPH